ncbi:MAG TPA: hypothetical protein VJ396_09305 [Acidiferrobacterales bacterium]|nr:hypothetical protein [Acidiferrobacterales bacterium]
MTFIDNHESVKHAGDIAAVSITIGTIVSFLPALAAIFTIIWTGIRIYESRTVQRFIRKRKRRARCSRGRVRA